MSETKNDSKKLNDELELKKAVYVRHLLGELEKITNELKALGVEVPSLAKNQEYEDDIAELLEENEKLKAKLEN
jgi:hypothetical protein